jgi:hypothetical protein
MSSFTRNRLDKFSIAQAPSHFQDSGKAGETQVAQILGTWNIDYDVCSVCLLTYDSPKIE